MGNTAKGKYKRAAILGGGISLLVNSVFVLRGMAVLSGDWGDVRLLQGLALVVFLVLLCFAYLAVLGLFLPQARQGAAKLLLAFACYFVVGIPLTMAGGKLAWSLGHLHFAKSAESESYMGIHVSLTGLRGLFAPPLGMWLWWLIGWKLWLVSIAIGLAALIMFAQMAARERRDQPDL